MESNFMPDFEPDAGRNAREREFLGALALQIPKWAVLGVSAENVMLQLENGLLTVAVAVSASASVLRTLRVDYYEHRVLMGEDETGQLVTVLDTERREVIEYRKQGAAPQEFAAVAANWLETEMRRSIELYEWTGESWQHRKWVFADTGQTIIWSDSNNEKRNDLGPPHRIRVVWPLR